MKDTRTLELTFSTNDDMGNVDIFVGHVDQDGDKSIIVI